MTCSQQAQVGRPHRGCSCLLPAPVDHCPFTAGPIRMSWMHLDLHQMLNDTERPEKWPLSLSGGNLMLTQVTYMHEIPREYYKSECNEVLNWIRQTMRLLCTSDSGSSWAELVGKSLGKRRGLCWDGCWVSHEEARWLCYPLWLVPS